MSIIYGLILVTGCSGLAVGYAASAFGYSEMWGRLAAGATICIVGLIALLALNAQASRLNQDEDAHREAGHPNFDAGASPSVTANASATIPDALPR